MNEKIVGERDENPVGDAKNPNLVGNQRSNVSDLPPKNLNEEFVGEREEIPDEKDYVKRTSRRDLVVPTGNIVVGVNPFDANFQKANVVDDVLGNTVGPLTPSSSLSPPGHQIQLRNIGEIDVIQNNVSLPPTVINKDFWEFFSNEEKMTLNAQIVEARNVKGTMLIVNYKDPQHPFLVLAPNDEAMQINLTRYKNKYVLNQEGWNHFITHNDLKSGDIVDIWAFRKAGAIGYALVMK